MANRKETSTKTSWRGMRSRCLCKSDASFKNYGGRGIRICRRWDQFENFLSDMGERPVGMTLDRIDANGDYTPENCRWATGSQQAANKREKQGLGMLVFNGKTQTASEWVREYGLGQNTLSRRIRSGMSIEDALLTKPRSKQPNARGKRTL
jgi:hypothetical protein